MRNVLFLCTGNSARSIMAEAYLNHVGSDHWRAYSAGSKPVGTPNPYAIRTLEKQGIAPAIPRSKSWNEFANDDAPIMDIVITVCDNAAGETCSVWPTQNGASPQKLHWSFPDPAAVMGDEAAILESFTNVIADIKIRIDALVAEYGQ